jgi:hypothetical protein
VQQNGLAASVYRWGIGLAKELLQPYGQDGHFAIWAVFYLYGAAGGNGDGFRGTVVKLLA